MIIAKVTPAQYVNLADLLNKEEGIQLSGAKGTVKHKGVTVEYEYDGEAQLKIEVTDAPFLVGKGWAESKLRSSLTDHGIVSV